MPVFVVTAPDGKKYKVTAPAGATQDEVTARVKAQHPAQKPTSFLQGVGESLADAAANVAYLNPFNGEGLYNAVAPALKKAGVPLQQSNSERGLRAERTVKAALQKKSPYRGSTAGHIVGDIAATALLPGGPVVQGAMSGAVLSQDPSNPASLAKDMAVGAVTSKAGEQFGKHVISPIAATGTKIAKRLLGKAAPVATEGTAALAPLGEDAVARAERFQRVGVSNPTLGMVTRDPRAWHMEQEGLKRLGSGDDLLRQVQQADQEISAAGQRLSGGFSNMTAEDVGRTVSNVLTEKDRQLGDAVNGLYKQVRAEHGDVPVGVFPKLQELLQSPDIADNATHEGITNSVAKRLARFEGGANIRQAEEFRKFIGGLGSDHDPGALRLRGIFKNALDDDVVDAVGSDAFKTARAAAKARFDEFRNTFAGKLIQDNVPEAITRRVTSAARPVQDLRDVVQSLQGAGPAGEDALQQLRQQTIADIIAPAAKGETIRPSALRDAVTRNRPKLQALLSPEQMKQLDDLMGAAGDVLSDVPRSNVNHSNTASSVANLFPDIGKPRFPRIHAAAGLAARLTGLGLGGAPGYVAADVGEGAVKAITRRSAARAAAKQAFIASDPRLAASLLKAAQQDEEIGKAIEPYVEGLTRIVRPAATASVLSLTQQ